MDYKEKVIALLNSQELSKEQKEMLETIFPELKESESEDERIRKWLIEMVGELRKANQTNADHNGDCSEAIAWLEKQKEPELSNDLGEYIAELSKQFPEVSFAKLSRIVVRVKNWLEKQVPINEEAEKEKNDYVSGQFLYCKGSFNEFKEGESYWIEYIGNDTYIGRSDNILNQKFHITPRQLYTWFDPRHPEKQGEQKQEANYPKFDFNDILALQCCMETVKKVQEDKELYGQLQSLHDRLYDAYRLEKQGEKGTNGNEREIPFSEKEPYEGLTDFERTLADICIGWIGEELGWKQYIKDNADVLLKIAIKKFNSSQDVVFEQKPAEFDDTNAKRMFIKALERVEEQNAKGYKLTDCDKNSWWEDFKAYTSCIIEQKPAEWSEEDEEIHRKCICAMRASACGFPEEEKFVEQVDNWLKSLKERYVWKPSDEQMDALHYVTNFDYGGHKATLVSLYEQLKKLKG